jgi:hypothetical protein
MYFSFFPKGTYDLKGDGLEKVVTNLLARVKVRSKIIDESSLYDLYDIPEGETPEITALKHFGNSMYHWVILITNNITVDSVNMYGFYQHDEIYNQNKEAILNFIKNNPTHYVLTDGIKAGDSNYQKFFMIDIFVPY